MMDDLDESDGGGGVRGRMKGIFTTRNTPFRSKISCLGLVCISARRLFGAGKRGKFSGIPSQEIFD